MVKVSACMAYCHNILSPKKFIIIIIIIIIIILIIMLIITFMQGIYNYIPEKIHVSWVYSVAAVLYLQFVLLFHPWNRLFYYYYYYYYYYSMNQIKIKLKWLV